MIQNENMIAMKKEHPEYNLRKLAYEFNVSRASVCRILNGKQGVK